MNHGLWVKLSNFFPLGCWHGLVNVNPALSDAHGPWQMTSYDLLAMKMCHVLRTLTYPKWIFRYIPIKKKSNLPTTIEECCQILIGIILQMLTCSETALNKHDPSLAVGFLHNSQLDRNASMWSLVCLRIILPDVKFLDVPCIPADQNNLLPG